MVLKDKIVNDTFVSEENGNNNEKRQPIVTKIYTIRAQEKKSFQEMRKNDAEQIKRILCIEKEESREWNKKQKWINSGERAQ